jgi:chromosome segregation ATPase
VDQVRREVQKRDQQNQALAKEVDALTGQAQFAHMAAGKVQDQARAKLQAVQTEIMQREEEIRRLNSQLKQHEQQLATMHVVNHIESGEIRSQGHEIHRRDQRIADLERELEDTRRRLDEVVMTRKSEGTALLEVEHFKADNERLVQMLATTKEFEAFGKLALDTSENTIRYMNPG